MILQALARYYDILAKDPNTDIAPPGYSTAQVSFALNISASGEVLDVFPLFVQEQRGKKVVESPRRMIVPERVKRSVDISPNFLCDNCVYVLGISDKEAKDPEYAVKRFRAFCKLNIALLERSGCAAGRAIIAFLEQHNPHKALENPVLAKHAEALKKGGNLVFQFQEAFAHEDACLRAVWDAQRAGEETPLGQCLISGEIAPIARLHPSLQLRGGQSSGATLVGFNAPAYESYHLEQGQVAPTSEKAVFAYSTALKYLLSRDNPNPKIFLGDTTVVYWAESDRQEYPAAFASIFGASYAGAQAAPPPDGRREAEEQLGKLGGKVQQARPVDAEQLLVGLDNRVRFYVLGLAPNSARVAVRFFINEPFGKLIERINQHYADLKLIKEFDNQPEHIPLYFILSETVSAKSKDKEAPPLLAGAVLRAILSGAPYPAALFAAIITRIRADQTINYVRVATLKAALLRKYRRYPQNPFQEVLEMSLNESSTAPAYVLGRLFAVLEKAQREAIGDANATIKDRYFTSACATPRSVFPVLLRLSQHHIAKADFGYASDNRIQALLNLLDLENNPFPAHLSLDEQGVFILGYYHQRAAFYVKKAVAANESSETK